MKKIIRLLLFMVLLSGITSCFKDKNLDNNGLPPATQEGKNTLGFMLNGKPWTPKGFNGTANLSLDYDARYRNGIFDIASYRITNDDTNGHIVIGLRDSLNLMKIPKDILLNYHSLFVVKYSNDECSYYSTDSNSYSTGKLTITKLDATSERVIISGKFHATLYKSGCDTIHITEGRFDMSLH